MLLSLGRSKTPRRRAGIFGFILSGPQDWVVTLDELVQFGNWYQDPPPNAHGSQLFSRNQIIHRAKTKREERSSVSLGVKQRLHGGSLLFVRTASFFLLKIIHQVHHATFFVI
ncbi:MAG TPA: hypothetical protein VMI94_26470 [Bryobacteraceae bacterium]|nr:hypothetical protein [Bryobacteraceae bacterium]